MKILIKYVEPIIRMSLKFYCGLERTKEMRRHSMYVDKNSAIKMSSLLILVSDLNPILNKLLKDLFFSGGNLLK